MSDRPKRSVRMTEDEAWAFVEAGHTGILTTLRQNGEPIALPVWYAVIDRKIYVSTRGKKVVRARNDSRASFLVESGERWAELQAVHVACEARVLEDPDEALLDRINGELNRKYDRFRSKGAAMPEASRKHYKSLPVTIIELTPTGKLLTWDNNHLTQP